MAPPRAAIIGLSGPVLLAGEAALLRECRPLGVILFARNVQDPAQLSRLTAAIREALGEDAPVLVDQEGGRVARLRPPHFPPFPAAGRFEGLPEAAAGANATLLGLECRGVGLDVVCAPVLDLRLPGRHSVVGDRGFGADPAEVARLGAAWVAGLQAAGTIPVIKHIPGHGRAMADSHLELPRVDASREDLQADFAPFRALADSGAWGMTAHILFDALDDRPATLSPKIIRTIIRGEIGFDGLLLSDDLAMKALTGTPASLTAAVLDAGCDVALNCTGVLADSQAALAGCPVLTEDAQRRLARSRAAVAARRLPSPDRAGLAAARDALLKDVA
ncbi:beta-N-acetylhexosaminidase [Pseudoroseomonas deserti]|uniref:beta-N-acetylhexosaminidase n=1 Tax=Teichococcus deserti TaxID=1817963 RepID=A0A1V2GUK5_9PROT|nr:beta-N-acetylhexosaminidase [Pseudoroseomonas deserti]ONG45203.1 beta-N-acetylhexosaminidase [Pseudoroseomonas deserti]